MCNNKSYQKSSVQTYNNSSQTLTTGSNLTFSNNSVDTGCSIRHVAGGTAITLKNPGLYLVGFDAIASASSTLSANISVQLYANGIAFPDAFSTASSDSSTNFINLSFFKLVKVNPSCCAVDNTTQLTFVNTGASAIFTHVNAVVVKLA